MVHRHRTYCLLRGGARAESNTCSRSRPGVGGGLWEPTVPRRGPGARSSPETRVNNMTDPHYSVEVTLSQSLGASATPTGPTCHVTHSRSRGDSRAWSVLASLTVPCPHLGPPAVPTIAQLGLLTPCPQTGWPPPPLRDVVCPEPLSRLPCVGGSRGQGWRPQILQQHMEGHGWGVCPLLRVVWLSDSGGSWGLRASETFHVEALVREAAAQDVQEQAAQVPGRTTL